MTRTTHEVGTAGSETPSVEELYRSLYELNPDAIVWVSLEGHFIAGNAAFERVTGFTAAELAGKPFDPLVVPEHAARVRRLFQLAVRGAPQYFEYAITHRDGHRVEVSGAKLPIHDAGGRVVGILGLGRDVTDRKRAAEGMRFLSDASRALAASLDYETTLRTVARLACPTLADFCMVDVTQEDGGVKRLAATHADPAHEPLVRELCQFPPNPEADGGIAFVLNAGRPLLVADFGENDVLAAAQNEQHAQIIRALAPRSVMSVPLVARDRTIGAITLARSRPGHRYGARELALAEELAARAALAVDNARLYREANAELAERKRAETALRQRGERLAGVVRMQQEIAGAPLEPAPLMQRVCERAAALTGADGAAVAVVEGDEIVYRAGCGSGQAYVGMRFGPDAPSGATLGAGATLHARDTETDPRVHRDAMRLTGSRSALMVPLIYNGAFVGTLGVVARAPGAFDAGDEETMQLVAGMLAAALSHATEFAAKQALLAERTSALAALRASEERYTLASKATNDLIYDWEVPADVLYWSDALFTVYGHRRAAVRLDLAWWEAQIHPDDRPRVVAALRDVLDSGEAFFSAEYRFRRGDGSYAVVLDRGYLVRDDDGTAVRMIGSMSDMTERRRAEEALRTSEERFRSLIENASDPIAILDAGGVFRYASPAHARVLGRRPEELVGTNAFDSVHPEDVAAVRETFARLLAAPGESVATQFRFRHAGGGWRTLAAVGRNLLGDPAVRGVVINSRDVTEQAALEAQLLQAQKMEAIGNLAGGVAHDFNNVLTVIRSFSELAVRATPAADPRREDLEEIRRAADRGAALVRQLLAFSRRQMLQPQLLGLGQVVAGVEGMLRSLIGEDIRLVTRLADAPRLIHADRVQIEQVLLNLAVNARDAMPRGGTLTIETGVAAPPPGDGAAPAVLLRVRDTGHGMTPEVRARVFEPFFTTKPPGRGTGLGLSTVYGIVEQSGGSIAVDSEPGRGTTFTISLPAAGAGAAPPANPAAAPVAAAGAGYLTPPTGASLVRNGAAAAAATGRGPRPTVMLVEDDAAVRALAHRVLREGGFAVLEAGSGDEALRLCAAHGPSVDLLLTDVVMPGMSGRELAERAAAALPRARILYMSGYTDDEILRRGLRDDSAELIEKPFTPQGLLGKVREVLRGD